MAAAAAAEGMRRPWERLEGKVVMVTGASSGIGRELCLDLAAGGCLVVAAARRAGLLRSLCDEINRAQSSAGVRAVAVELDVTATSAEIEASVKKAWDAFGRIDAIVNNAGIRGDVHPSLDWSEEDWNAIIKTNLTGLFLVSKFVCSHMRDTKQKGSVINISSIAGLQRGHLPGGLPYDASKTGVNALTKVMAMELGVHNIRVNSIAPGLFKSEITKDLMEKEWLSNVYVKIIPLRTNGTINPALTSVVRYLIHDSSQYVSGNVFVVDAGASLPGFPIFSSL